MAEASEQEVRQVQGKQSGTGERGKGPEIKATTTSRGREGNVGQVIPESHRLLLQKRGKKEGSELEANRGRWEEGPLKAGHHHPAGRLEWGVQEREIDVGVSGSSGPAQAE